jgi:hypothetical protein
MYLEGGSGTPSVEGESQIAAGAALQPNCNSAKAGVDSRMQWSCSAIRRWRCAMKLMMEETHSSANIDHDRGTCPMQQLAGGDGDEYNMRGSQVHLAD